MRREARLTGFGVVLILAACNRPDTGSKPMEYDQAESTAKPAKRANEAPADEGRAVATLEGRSGSSLTGTATFTEADGGDVSLTLRVQNAPAGAHAVHLHENGDCSARDASSAGKHWNPTGEIHGRRGEYSFHEGDIGNLTVGANRSGSLSVTVTDWSLEETGDESVLGRALVVHSGADDFRTQPDGAAGQRIGCGVIERSYPVIRPEGS
jgi:Cu-Zn family superoxide dismutase